MSKLTPKDYVHHGVSLTPEQIAKLRGVWLASRHTYWDSIIAMFPKATDPDYRRAVTIEVWKDTLEHELFWK